MACPSKKPNVIRRWDGQAFGRKTGSRASLETPTNNLERLLEVLAVLDPPAARRLWMCGMRLPLRCRACGHATQIRFSCNLRICAMCSRARAQKLRTSWRYALRAMILARLVDPSKLRFVTLTLRTDGNVRERVEKIQRAFALFWRKTWEAEKGSGAIFVLEVGQALNVHIHALVHGRYISQGRLSRLWREITGDSYVVDIRRVRGVDAVLCELLKYLTKGITSSDDPYYLAVVHMAFRGKRALSTKGLFYGIGLRVVDHLSCGRCGGQLVVDFPWHQEHGDGCEPFRWFEIVMNLAIDDG